MKIEIKDERVSETNPIAVAMENIKAEIVEAKPTTFTTLDIDSKEVEVELNIKQPPVQITLKDLDMQISDTEIALANAQTSVENLTAELQKIKDLRVDLAIEVQIAYDNLQVALKSIETLPVKEIIK